MEEWKEYKLGEVCTELSDGLHKAPKFKMGGDYIFVNAKNIVGGFIVDNDPTKKSTLEEYLKYASPLNDTSILYSIDGTIGNVALYRGEKCILGKGACYMNPNPQVLDRMFLYYELQSPRFKSYIDKMSTGSTIKHISLKTMRGYNFTFPSLETQRQISSILQSLDDKIEINRRINDNFVNAIIEVMLIWLLISLRNDNLEQQAQALFKSWFIDFDPFKGGEFEETELGFIPKDWEVVSLSAIADYINGLAMQKYRPTDGESGIPVLKIKELGQGRTDDSSELCSPSLIGSKYIIDDGDIIFSWSGTLMVKVWCGGKCGLNQHLFVVKPKEYPQWFAYQWTKHHLDNFIHIAKDKAVTMGHIKRGELDKAKVVVPDETNMATIDLMMKPIHNQIISNMKESRRLASLRDTLLPRLMSGELKVNEIENVI